MEFFLKEPYEFGIVLKTILIKRKQLIKLMFENMGVPKELFKSQTKSSIIRK